MRSPAAKADARRRRAAARLDARIAEMTARTCARIPRDELVLARLIRERDAALAAVAR